MHQPSSKLAELGLAAQVQRQAHVLQAAVAQYFRLGGRNAVTCNNLSLWGVHIKCARNRVAVEHGHIAGTHATATPHSNATPSVCCRTRGFLAWPRTLGAGRYLRCGLRSPRTWATTGMCTSGVRRLSLSMPHCSVACLVLCLLNTARREVGHRFAPMIHPRCLVVCLRSQLLGVERAQELLSTRDRDLGSPLGALGTDTSVLRRELRGHSHDRQDQCLWELDTA
mmetsp:Transcript_3638/g.7733  ORF Transcript_3638/g.7733 Transcript_3638/m.7733 type:complete len:225 (-) Transcript_3638:290-964(-)